MKNIKYLESLCEDCGEKIYVRRNHLKTRKRCKDCQAFHLRQKRAEYIKKYRANLKNKTKTNENNQPNPKD